MGQQITYTAIHGRPFRRIRNIKEIMNHTDIRRNSALVILNYEMKCYNYDKLSLQVKNLIY